MIPLFLPCLENVAIIVTDFKYEIPATNDPNMKLEIVYQGNYTPGLRELNQFTPVTQFAFLGNMIF